MRGEQIEHFRQRRDRIGGQFSQFRADGGVRRFALEHEPGGRGFQDGGRLRDREPVQQLHGLAAGIAHA